MVFFSIDVSVNNICRPEDKGDIIREVKEADATFAMDRLLDNSKLVET